MNYIKQRLQENWEDAHAIYTTSLGIVPQGDVAGDIIKLLTILIPFLSSRKKKDPVRVARKELKRLRRDLRKKKIDQEEYERLRKETLNTVSPLN